MTITVMARMSSMAAPPQPPAPWDPPPTEEAARIAQALKVEPTAWREVTRRGQTNAAHWLVALPSRATGRS